MRGRARAALLALFLFSCGGSVVRLNATTYQIVYSSRGVPQGALQGALKQAAATVIRDGHRYFRVIDRDASESARMRNVFGKPVVHYRSTATLTFEVVTDDAGRATAYDACAIQGGCNP